MQQLRVISSVVLVALFCLTGCQTPSPTDSSAKIAEPVQRADESVFDRCYQLDSAASELRLLVYKDGPLARVGHNHVMVSYSLIGALALARQVADSILRVVLPVTSLEVDPPALRAQEGEDFSSVVSDEARAGTRTNMLGDGVLSAAEFPELSAEMVSLTGPLWSADAILRITLKD